MKTNNFSLHRLRMLIRAEFQNNKKVWMLVFAVYFLLIAFFVFVKYFFVEFNFFVELNSKRAIIGLFSALITICFFASIFLSQMVFKSYTNKNKATITLMTPASKWEKYLTAILFSLVLPVCTLAFIPLVVYALWGVSDHYLSNNIGWYMMLVSLMVTINLMRKGYLRYFLTLTSVILVFLFFRYMQETFFLANWQVLAASYITFSLVTLIASWYLFKNYSTDKIWDKI